MKLRKVPVNIWRIEMKAESVANSGGWLISIALAVVSAAFIYVVLANRNVPLISSVRGALVALVILGFTMCVAGGLANKVESAGFSWLSPFVILGFLLGLAAIYVGFAGLTGRPLPFVTGERGAFVLLAGIILAKWVLSRIHTLLLG
jgi:hypothetical protein